MWHCNDKTMVNHNLDEYYKTIFYTRFSVRHGLSRTCPMSKKTNNGHPNELMKDMIVLNGNNQTEDKCQASQEIGFLSVIFPFVSCISLSNWYNKMRIELCGEKNSRCQPTFHEKIEPEISIG